MVSGSNWVVTDGYQWLLVVIGGNGVVVVVVFYLSDMGETVT